MTLTLNRFEPMTEADALAAIRKRTGVERAELTRVVHELAKRQCEALKIFEPLSHVEPFHACRAPERILRGSNRSGKTVHAAVEFSRAVVGSDPHDKYPKTNGRAFVVGATGQHIGEVLYRKLFRAGAFKMIRDEKTGVWRAFRPWEPADKLREKQAKPAPPLIPPRMVEDIAWENKKEQIPSVVRMKNGWEIRFFSSQGIPPQGSDVDLVWFDEEIVHPLWYSEVAARGTVDREGKFYWSATAQKGGPQLYEMCERAEEEKDKENPRVVEVFAHINDNKFFSDEQRELFFAKLSEEERAIRIEGEFAFVSFKIYPEFDRRTHGIPWFDIPSNWTRYMVVDPGRQVCAVLFAAVPPPDYIDPDCVVLYDELYIRDSTARRFGEEVKRKSDGQEFYAFLIDHQGGRVRDAGRGLTIEEQYAEELKRQGVKSRTTGYGFTWGSTDVKAGLEKVRSCLLIRDNGKPKLLYIHDKMPNFWHEMTRYHWKRTASGMKELKEEPEKRNDHQCDNLRYLCMYDPKHHRPSIVKKAAGGVHAYLKRKRERLAKMHGQEGVVLGPQGSTR